MNTKLLLAFVAVAAGPAQAAPRLSAHYSIAAETADSGGRRATSASYTHDGSAGLLAGIANVAAPPQTAKHGYVAQLFDVTGLVVNAAAPSVDENATLPLGAWQLLDDATFLAVIATSVNWNVVGGPITGIATDGVATTASVFQNTPASVQGTLGTFTGTLNLTVLDTLADNFGLYAGDGLGDDWQVQHFGPPPNADASPLADPDGDGQTNAFEFTAGLVPNDATSVFRFRIEAVPGQPNQKRLILHPRFADRGYVVKAAPSLQPGLFLPLGSVSTTDNAQVRIVTDLNAAGAVKFYRVEITRP